MVPELRAPDPVGRELTASVWGLDDVGSPTAACLSEMACLPISHIQHPRVLVRAF